MTLVLIAMVFGYTVGNLIGQHQAEWGKVKDKYKGRVAKAWAALKGA